MDKPTICVICGINELTPEDIETTGDTCSECFECGLSALSPGYYFDNPDEAAAIDDWFEEFLSDE